MGDLNVTPAALSEASIALRAESRRIEEALLGLEAEVSTLRQNWDGAARTAYEAAQREWSMTFTQMKDTLASIATATQQIAEDYVEADRRSAKLFRR